MTETFKHESFLRLAPSVYDQARGSLSPNINL